MICKKKFEIYESTLKSSNSSGKFCSKNCYYIYLKTLTGNKNKNYKRINKKCVNCGKDMHVIPSKDKDYKNNFCSKECKYQYHHNYIEGNKNCNWLGGHKNYRGDFETIKKKYFSGINYCYVCQTTKYIHIHHIIPYRFTKNNSLNNLIPVCRKHHKQIENLTIKYFQKNSINNEYESHRDKIMSLIKNIK